MAVPVRGVNYFRIFWVDLAKDDLKLHSIKNSDFGKWEILSEVLDKRCIQKSRSALRWLETSKATDSSVARCSRDTRRGFDFEFRESIPMLKSGCNIWQILWLTIVWPREVPQGNFCEHERIFMCCWVTTDRYGKEKHKNWVIWFTLYYHTFLSEAGTINYPVQQV